MFAVSTSRGTSRMSKTDTVADYVRNSRELRLQIIDSAVNLMHVNIPMGITYLHMVTSPE